MQWLADLITEGAEWVLDLLIALLKLLGVIVVDMVCFVLDGLCQAAVALLDAVDLSSLQTMVTGAWDSVDPAILAMASVVGLGECMLIIATALGIRFVLQLIPFVRLGS